ncbi:QRFP-like peptide receptor [Actinia tenebrosa]|uniref:QRFP-like peptide receptor n=1 Tax=Actinia tenebrosa TaxID=6105 RepID=A0A6P8ILL5_ACTTE|nr:QRFP-like peptide receptor [Actinia tenebrosa]
MASANNTSYTNYSSGEQHTRQCVDEESKLGVMTVKSLAYCIVIILSLIGNGLVIRIFYKNRSVLTTTNCFIVNMAASDIMLPVFVIPRHVLAVFEEGPYGLHAWHVNGIIGELLCKLIPFIGDVSNSVSIFTLVLISCDRYFAIVWPLSYKLHITTKKCTVLIAATWTIAFIVHAPYFYSFKLYHGFKDKTLCVSFWSSVDKLDDDTHVQKSLQSQKTYFLFLLVVVYVLPLTIITIMYSSIIRELRVSIRNHSSQQRRQRRREDNRVIAMLVIIVTIFAVFFAPIHILYFLQNFVLNATSDTCKMSTIQFSFFFLTLSTCCVNPYIYFIFLRKYRHGVKTLLKEFFASRFMTVCPVTRASKCCIQTCLDDLEEGLQATNNARHRNSSSCRVRHTEHIILASEQEETIQFETGV